MIRVLYVGSTSACLEIVNQEPYYAPRPYSVWLNGDRVSEGSANVFSVFRLRPDASYLVRAAYESGGGEETVFRTPPETCALDVRSFGAAGDGETDDTEAVQAAIHFLPPGGRLYFPEGVYRTRPLALKSHIHLEFGDGAVLLGSEDRDRYPVLPGTAADLDGGPEVHFGAFEGCAVPMRQALLTAAYAENITITGPGTVDGNGRVFWEHFREDPVARPRLFFFNRCKGVRVHGLRAQNAASWQFHPYYSEDLAFYDVTVEAPQDSPNTDALDPESCDGVEIIGCRFSVGDDCIAIKSGRMELGTQLNRPASRHTIRNCLMENGHGAVTLGSEIGAGVRDLCVTQCLFRGTDRGLRVKTRRGRGKNCRIEDVAFENIRMENVRTPVVVNMWYNCCDPDRESEYVWSREALPVDDRTPHLGTFRFRNLVCGGAQTAACYVDGLPESPVDEVSFEHVSISFAPDAKPGIPAMQNFAEERCRLGFYFDNVRRVRLENVSLTGAAGERLTVHHCGEVLDSGEPPLYERRE